MGLNHVQEALQHCYRRQAESGPRSSFRFSLFVGPQRKPISAIYPDPSDAGPAQSDNPPKKKDKGKQREDPLQGLLRIDESVEPPIPDPAEPVTQQSRTPTAAGPAHQRNPTQKPSEPQTSAALHENDLVRINMGQMLQLKDKGYEAVGPVNGPNEGYPEYEVPKAMLQVLESRSQTSPSPGQVQREMHTTETEPAPNMIDPALLPSDMLPVSSVCLTAPPNEGQTNDPSSSERGSLLPPEVGSIVRPITPPNADASSAHDPNCNKTPTKRLGKRANCKKKKLTDDDRAAMKAQSMVQSGSRPRTQTRRK
jgi:hypothetical protein